MAGVCTESSRDDAHGPPFGTLESLRSRHKFLENILIRSPRTLKFRKGKKREATVA